MRKWLATLGGVGLAPVMPGTLGSLVTAGAVWLVYGLWWSAAGGMSVIAWNAALGLGLLLTSALTVALGPWALTHWADEDPGPFVMDEAAGICLTMLFQPIRPGWGEGLVVLWAFGAFRVFDIWKPPPARQLERLPAGWGMLADDLMAAVYANLLCQVILRWAYP